MPSVNFAEFEILWKNVEKQFAAENNGELTLDKLRDLLIERNMITAQSNFTVIEEKFLRFRNLSDKPQNINISNTIFNALFNYLGVRGISELKGEEYISSQDVLKKIQEEASNPGYGNRLPEIGFLGRKKELQELEEFLRAPESRIFALYGVPMIGKTKLVNHFLENSETAKTFDLSVLKLNPDPDNAEHRIRKELFGNSDLNDLSALSPNSIIVIQNFEEALKWTGNVRELHNIRDEYAKIKTFLEKISELDSIKLILESRFQIHFELFLPNWRKTVRTLQGIQLRGLSNEEFWPFYRAKGFSLQQFEHLSQNFDNHTGLLAFAYNDMEWLFQNNLIEALYQPKVTTRLLWDLIELIIDRLEKSETWILCALTFLQEPVRKEDLYTDFLTLPDFKDEFQVDDAFNSLTNKLLVQSERGLYDLNPYIREVCYTFLKVKRRTQIQTIQNLSYFKEYAKAPYYDRVRQAYDRGDYLFLLRLGQDLRKEGRFSEAIKVFEAELNIDPRPEIVLNEIGITYKRQKNWKKAIETLEEAKRKYPNNGIILNELGICYREGRQLDKAIETLEEAKQKRPDDVKILNELGICYREGHQLEKAIETLEEARRKHSDDTKTLNELGISYRQNHQLEKAIEILIKASELGSIYSYNELGISYRENHQLDKAIETLEKAKEKFPGNERILNELGICYRENNELDKAIKVLEGVKKNHPENVRILNELGICYRENHQLDKAIKVLGSAIELGNIHSFAHLGICYRENAQLEKAIEILKKGISLGSIQSYEVLSDIYKEKNDLQKAFEIVQKGVRTTAWKNSGLVGRFHELEKLLKQPGGKNKAVRKLNVFLSYSHKDEDIKNELNNHLSALKKSDKISTWHDRELPAGTEWDKAIKAELENADIVLLLISADFNASEYIRDVEIKKAIEKNENKTAVVVPIFCRMCDFSEMPYAKLQGLPKDARFIKSQPNEDEAYTEVAKGIKTVVDKLLS